MATGTPKPLAAYIDALGHQVRRITGDVGATAVTMAASDSRRIEPGGLFVAIPGAVQDGVRFIPDALARGAVAVVSVDPQPLPDGVVGIEVEDAYHAAGRIAEEFHERPADRLKLIGVTGTNGKTTCAYLLQRMLREAGWRAGMVGTVEYDDGRERHPADRTTPTPFDVQRLFKTMVANQCEFAVVEVSSHALHQRRLGTARFHGAVFTNLSGDHLDYHKTMEAYFQAKSILFHECLADDAPAVINIDDVFGRRLLDDLRRQTPARALGFGRADQADYRLTAATTSLEGCEALLQGVNGLELAVHSALIGDFNIMNLAATVGLALELGVASAAIQRAVVDFTGAPGRMQRIDAAGGFKVFVDYAHTDDALHNVLSTLRALEPRRLIVVFGCGGDRDRSKRPRMARVAAQWADHVIVTSDNPRTEEPAAILDDVLSGVPAGFRHVERIGDRRAAIRAALTEAREGDAVLIAGKGHENYQEIHGVKHHFDDREEVEQALKILHRSRRNSS